MSNQQNSHRDKRVSKITRESEKLRQEITELEDALILHSRYQAEDDTSIRGMIRREVGGSCWEHGGEGKLHTYRGNQDLTERSGSDKQSRVKEKASTGLIQRKRPETHRNTSSRSASSKVNKQQFTPEVRAASATKSERKPVDKTCLNGDWALNSDKTTKRKPSGSTKGSSSEIDALKNRVLAKASAKVIKRKDFAPSSENKNNLSLNDIISADDDHSNKLQDIKKRELSDKNKQNNDISYSLSFLESLQDSETQDSNLSKHSSAQDDEQLQNKLRDISKLPNEFDGGCKRDINSEIKANDLVSDTNCEKPSKSKVSKSRRWATERNKVSTDLTQVHSRTQRRNSIGDTCHQNVEDNSKVLSKNRLSQPVGETDRQLRKTEDTHEGSRADFPLLFGSIHKTLDGHSYATGSNVHVTLKDETSASLSNHNDVAYTDLDNGLSSMENSPRTENMKSIPSTKQSIIICDEEVQSWLENLGLQDVDSYVRVFSDHQMDISSIKLLTAGRLREMGIHALGPIMKIMKGVQVLNRDSSLKEDVTNENILEDQLKGPENDSSSNIKCFSERKYDIKNLCDKAVVQSEEILKETTQNQKSPMACPTSLFWNKTADEAEYVNLTDRSPVDEVNIPQAVTIKEKSKKLEKEKKSSSSSSSKSSQKKTRPLAKTDRPAKDEIQLNSKIVRKPPVKNKDGISSAHEKYLERRKQEELKVHSDQITSARQRQLRDKMAARHTSRRSSSLEREVLSSRNQQISLNRTLSENQNQQNELGPSRIPQGMEDCLETKPLGVIDGNGDTMPSKVSDMIALEEEDGAVRELLNTKNLDHAVEKLTDEKESLNLSIVRQLKKQLHHIEQQLVQKMEQPIEENVTGKSQDEINQHRKNMTRDSNVRTSARERRRQRNPNQFSTTLEGNDCHITQEFFKVGGIMSHRKQKDDECIAGVREDIRNAHTSQNGDPGSKFEVPQTTKTREDSSTDETQAMTQHITDNNARKEQRELSPKDRMTTNTGAQILDNIHSNRASRQADLSRGKLAMAQEYLRKIEIDKKDISFQEEDLLGDGGFSQVYKGIYQGSEVAIKQLKTSLTSNDKNYFSAEVSLLQELRHPHVVMLLGVCTAYTCPVLVLEYMQGGNLHTRIHDNTLPPFLKDEFCLISRDIASGICYLHHHRPPVLHLDLKSRNVLLGLGNRAKVADFGFSKWKVDSDLHASRSSKSKLTQGSPAWMAPELLTSGEITPKADVYSFAIVLWEMLVREDPYKGCSTFQILERVRTCQRPTIPNICPPDLKKLMEKCWEQNPCTRPTFKEILPDLEKVSSCEEWLRSSQVIAGSKENMDSRKSQNSGEMKENVRDSLPRSTTPRTVTKIFGAEKQFDNDVGHIEDDNIAERVDESSDRGDKLDFRFTDKSPNTIHGKDKERLEENITNTSTDLTRPATYSFQPASLRVSLCESERSGCVNSVPEMESNEAEMDSLLRNKTRQSAVVSDESPRVFDNETEKSSSLTQILLDSARDTKKFDDLLSKYLPSPSPRSRDQTKKYNRVSNSCEVSRKLLPLRQSLDKPKKPPKPLNVIRVPMSQSENFGMSVDGDISVPDMEMDEVREVEKFGSNIEQTLSENYVKTMSGRTSHDKMSSEVSPDEQIEQKNGSSSGVSRVSLSPISSRSRSQRDEVRDISLHNLNISNEQSDYQSGDPDIPVNKSSKVSSSSENFLSVTKEIEQTLSSLHSITMPPSSPSTSFQLQPKQIPEGTSIEVNEVPENNVNTSFKEESIKPDNSFNKDSCTEISIAHEMKLNLDECRSSVSTNMSVDSLSLSLSDDEDSIDFSKTDLSHKKGKSGVYKEAPILTVKKADRNMFAPSIKNNLVTHANTKSHANMRESFFLFNDFHLDLNKLSDNDSDAEGNAPVPFISPSKAVNSSKKKNRASHTEVSKLHQANISLTENQHITKHSQKIKHQSQQKNVSNKTGEVGISTQGSHQSHPFNGKMNPALKESIHLINQLKDKDSANPIPPPLPPFMTSYQIKRNSKDHANPVRSGFPIKSSSTKPEVQGHSRFSVEPGLLLQQRNKLRSVIPEELSPLKEAPHGRSMPSVASILKKAMDDRRLAMGDNQESQEGLTTPEASWSIQD